MEVLRKKENGRKSGNTVIAVGDFSGKLGSERHENTVGPYGLGECNKRGIETT